MRDRQIANIDISKEYDESLGTDDVHYQSFARMAAFFGRHMLPHRHEQYFQMHFLNSGQIELQLDDHRYSVEAPLFVLTPPSVPHAFITESDPCWKFCIRALGKPSACRGFACHWQINPTNWRRWNTIGN